MGTLQTKAFTKHLHTFEVFLYKLQIKQ